MLSAWTALTHARLQNRPPTPLGLPDFSASFHRAPNCPISQMLNKVGGLALIFGARGGKVDDITAVVAVVA